VWDSKGVVVFERVLQSECKMWAIQMNYFIYKPTSSLDSNHDCFHIFNLQQASVFLVKDWVEDPAYSFLFFHVTGFFFVGSPHCVQVIHLKDNLREGETSPVKQVEQEEVRTVRMGLKLWGMMQNQEVYEED